MGLKLTFTDSTYSAYEGIQVQLDTILLRGVPIITRKVQQIVAIIC